MCSEFIKTHYNMILRQLQLGWRQGVFLLGTTSLWYPAGQGSPGQGRSRPLLWRFTPRRGLSPWEAGQEGGQEDEHMHKELCPTPDYSSCAIQSADIPHAFQRPSFHISLQHSQLMREQIKLSLL